MSGIGKYQTISYEAVIASAKSMLNLEGTSDYDLFLESMIDEALRQINDLTMFEKQTCILDINDGIAQLPCNFMKLYGARFSVNGNCSPIPYIERSFITSCGCDAYPIWGNGGGIEITGGNIVFHNAEALQSQQVSIAYLGRRTDEQGRPLMLVAHERAARAYACARFCQRMAPMQPTAMLMQGMKQDARHYNFEYAGCRAKLRGQAAQDNFDEDRLQTGRIFNAWITAWRNTFV